MESLNPALNLALTVRRAIECGESPRTGFIRFFKTNEGEFPLFCKRWMDRTERGLDRQALMDDLKSPHRRALLMVVERGLRGEPIHALLLDTENEINQACQREIDRHLALLPFQLMVPLLLFLFPALMILVLSPFLDALAGSLVP